MEDSLWQDMKPRNPGGGWVSWPPASLTFSVVCLSLLPQHGAQCFPTQHLLSGDSVPSGRTKLNRSFRKCLTHTRICIQVCKFLEIISKDGMCCFLRPDLSLRCPGWPAPPSAAPHPPLHTCLPHPFISASPLCSPLPYHPLLFSPDWLALSFHHCALWISVSLGQESANFFFAKIQIKILSALCSVLSLLQRLTFALVAQRQAKIIHR